MLKLVDGENKIGELQPQYCYLVQILSARWGDVRAGTVYPAGRGRGPGQPLPGGDRGGDHQVLSGR